VPRALAALLLCGACTNHLLIGGVDIAEEPEPSLDAGKDPTLVRDASGGALDSTRQIPIDDAGPGGPLRATFRAFEREDILSLDGPCGAPCIDAEIVVAGGAPPYEVQWSDGELGAQRKLCGGEPLFPSEVNVFDANGKQVQLSTLVTAIGGCDGGAASAWTVCLKPPELVPPCGGGGELRFELPAPLSAAMPTIAVTFQVPLLSATDVAISVAAWQCGPELSIAEGTVHSLNTTLQGTYEEGVVPRYIIVHSLNDPNGKLPEGLTASVSICFED
jgi:hypothetical protein